MDVSIVRGSCDERRRCRICRNDCGLTHQKGGSRGAHRAEKSRRGDAAGGESMDLHGSVVILLLIFQMIT